MLALRPSTAVLAGLAFSVGCGASGGDASRAPGDSGALAPPVDAAAPDAALAPERDAVPVVDGPPVLDAAPPDAAPPDAAPPEGDAEECPRGPSGRCEAVRWRVPRVSYPVPVDHHTTLVTEAEDGAWLMVFGGNRSTSDGGIGEVYSAVRRARVNAGEVEPFVDEPPLPFPIAFHGQAQTRDFVYLLAGVTADERGPGANATALVGRLAEGHVAEWREAPLPPSVRVHPTAVVLGDRVLVVGGTAAQGEILDTVISAPIGADGMLGAFEPEPSLPAPRSHHSAVVANGALYVLGGFTVGSVAEPTVLRGVTGADGRLAGWEAIGTLENAPWTASTVVHRGWLWLLGGGEGDGAAAHFVTTVRGAPLQPDGSLGPFEVLDDPLLVARSHVHQTPVYDGFVYSVGGRSEVDGSLASIDDVYAGRLW